MVLPFFARLLVGAAGPQLTLALLNCFGMNV